MRPALQGTRTHNMCPLLCSLSCRCCSAPALLSRDQGCSSLFGPDENVFLGGSSLAPSSISSLAPPSRASPSFHACLCVREPQSWTGLSSFPRMPFNLHVDQWRRKRSGWGQTGRCDVSVRIPVWPDLDLRGAAPFQMKYHIKYQPPMEVF